MKRILICVLLCISSILFAIDIEVDTKVQASTDNLSLHLLTGLYHSMDYFNFTAELGAANDGKYTPYGDGQYTNGFYYFLHEGGFEFDLDLLKLKMGRFAHNDVIDSPYSVFISSEEIPAVLIDIDYEDDFFFFRDRWIQLNTDSALYYIYDPVDNPDGSRIDRSANFKAYGLKMGNFRFGIEDSLVYARSFDVEYFLNPVPSYFLQYINNSSGKPWTQAGNDNAIMGLFTDWRRDGIYAYGQLFVDDFNINRWINPEGMQSPDKVAWSLGGSYETSYGRFGLYNGGATKYTFQPYGDAVADEDDPGDRDPSDEKYGYTYYPATSYLLGSGKEVALDYIDNYLGYKYGENNLAFLLDYTNSFGSWDTYGFLEFTVSGAKSPANPWHEWYHWKETGKETLFLDGDRLEKKLLLHLEAGRQFGDFYPYAVLETGMIWNVLELTDPEYPLSDTDIVTDDHPNNSTKIFAPSNSNEGVLKITIGCTYRYSF